MLVSPPAHSAQKRLTRRRLCAGAPSWCSRRFVFRRFQRSPRVASVQATRTACSLRMQIRMSTYHAAVWLDHNEARIFHITKTTFDETTVHSDTAHTQLHRKSGPDAGHRAKENQDYYHEVVQALSDAGEVLVLGPSTAKLELIKHAHRHDPKLEAKIIGVETVDHPTDGQLVAYMRKYFKEAALKHPS